MTLVPAVPVEGDAVISLASVKAFLRVDGGGEDAVIAQLRASAINWVERYTARSLVRRGWRLTLAAFAPVIRLPIGPVAADGVTSIAYRDASGAAATIAAGGWIVSAGAVIAAPGTWWPAAWAADGAVAIEFDAGYLDVAVEAPGLVTAVLLLTRHLYDRGDSGGDGEASPAVRALCDAVRVPVIG